MQLFKVVPEDLFSVLASPNRELYADALDVLYTAYQEQLKIPEETLYILLRNNLEKQLEDASFDEEDIDAEELADLSGRARFLIRKLCSKGWFEKERGDDFNEYITVPGYSSSLLELFHKLRDDTPMRGYSYVFNTYSTLKVADESENIYEKMTAVYSAYENMEALIKTLQMVYHNVKHFFQIQMEMQDVNTVLESHYDDFGQKVVESYIRPLKIKDSVPKYRVPIQTILKKWLQDDDLLLQLSNAALQDKRGISLEQCRNDLMRKIYYINDHYDSIEHDYLEEIDRQVRRYTRATTKKIEILTNRDQNVRGNLNYLLDALSKNRHSDDLIEQIQPIFQLYEQSFLSSKSLWYRKRSIQRVKTEPVILEENGITEKDIKEAEKLLHSEYARKNVLNYMEKKLGDSEVCYSKNLSLVEDKDYIMSLMMILVGSEQNSPYKVTVLEGNFTENGYTIPQLEIKRKGKNL